MKDEIGFISVLLTMFVAVLAPFASDLNELRIHHSSSAAAARASAPAPSGEVRYLEPVQVVGHRERDHREGANAPQLAAQRVSISPMSHP